MQPRMVERQFRLVGFEEPIDFSKEFGETVNAMWARLAERLAEIPGREQPDEFVGFWHMMSADVEGYLAGVAVTGDAPPPEGMVAVTVPASCYAVFRERQRGTMGGPEGYAYKVWLPQSGMHHNEAVRGDFEVFDAPPPNPYVEADIYIPVKG